MDNVALSFLLVMANVAYCRDGLCRSGLWARCILTAIRTNQCCKAMYEYSAGNGDLKSIFIKLKSGI